MTHYDEFGLTPAALPEEIQRAHRNLARLLHPDPIQDEELRRLAENQLKRLNHVYSVLIDPARRRSYDLQLSSNSSRPGAGIEFALVPPFRHPPPPPPVALWRRVRWHVPVVAGLSLLAGFQAAVTYGTPERVVFVDRQPQAPLPGAAIPTPSGPAEDGPWPATNTRELRRMLNQALHERDSALAKLQVRPAPVALTAEAANPHVQASATAAAAPAAVAEPPRTNSAVVAMAQPPTIDPGRRVAQAANLAGTWIYSAPGARFAPGDQYPAEYIELVLGERDDLVSGRYRARYKVADRALNPEVEFFFQGASAGDRRYGWRGNGGAKGEIHLKLLSDNALSLNWFASQLGQHPMLGSGTAVLVRRRQD